MDMSILGKYPQAPFKNRNAMPINMNKKTVTTSEGSVKKIIIKGVTCSGKKFRPSDWAERMSGALSTFGRDHRIQYSPMLQPLTINGVKCISIDPSLKEIYPEMFSYIMHCVDINQLNVTET